MIEEEGEKYKSEMWTGAIKSNSGGQKKRKEKKEKRSLGWFRGEIRRAGIKNGANQGAAALRVRSSTSEGGGSLLCIQEWMLWCTRARERVKSFPGPLISLSLQSETDGRRRKGASRFPSPEGGKDGMKPGPKYHRFLWNATLLHPKQRVRRAELEQTCWGHLVQKPVSNNLPRKEGRESPSSFSQNRLPPEAPGLQGQWEQGHGFQWNPRVDFSRLFIARSTSTRWHRDLLPSARAYRGAQSDFQGRCLGAEREPQGFSPCFKMNSLAAPVAAIAVVTAKLIELPCDPSLPRYIPLLDKLSGAQKAISRLGLNCNQLNKAACRRLTLSSIVSGV